MPRADTTPTRRAKRDARRPVTQKLARTAASVRAEALARLNSNGGGSISAPAIVKREPVSDVMPPAPKTSVSASASPQRGWRHPDELAYIRSAGKTWPDIAIARFVAANAFGVPPRGTHAMDPWVHVRCRSADGAGSEVVLPRGYRLPLLWVAKYLWTSVQLVLTAAPAIRQREWDAAKFEILHIARLCAGLLAAAKTQMDEGGVIDRGWRCPLFDRALHRYWHEWLIMRDEFVRDFFREFGEEEFQRDVLKFTWSRWVLKSHKGFALTKAEVDNGISAAEFMGGFVVDDPKGTFEWREALDDTPHFASEVEQDTTEEKEITQTHVPVEPEVVQTQTAAPTSAPSRVVSFLIRPHNVFRAPVPEGNAVQVEIAGRGGGASVDDAVVAPMAEESVAQNGDAPASPPVISGQTTQVKSMENADAGHGEMQVDPPEERTIRGALSTTMGNVRPGSAGAVLRGHSEEASRPRSAERETEEEEEEDESSDEEMPQVPQTQVPIGDPDLDELDLDTDLELQYPDQEDVPGPPAGNWLPESQSVPRTGTASSASNVSSRSVSPVAPLSSARFPTSDNGSASAGPLTQQLTVYPGPHYSQGQAPPDVTGDPGLIGRFLHSCGVLGDEMRALRAEVAQLRSEREGPVVQLEERVRRLEARAEPLLVAPAATGNVTLSGSGDGAGARWAHPLAHLMSLDSDSEVEITMDAGVSPMGEGLGAGSASLLTRYGSVNGEPVPPRSRKFNNRLPNA